MQFAQGNLCGPVMIYMSDEVVDGSARVMKCRWNLTLDLALLTEYAGDYTL